MRAFKNKWIAKDGAGFVRAVEAPADETADQLRTIAEKGQLEDAAALKELQKRKLVSPRKHIHYSVKKGAHFATEVKQLETDLTEDMIASCVFRTEN